MTPDLVTVKNKFVRFTHKSLMKEFGLNGKDASSLCLEADGDPTINRFYNIMCSNCEIPAWSVEHKKWSTVNSGWCQECGKECKKKESEVETLYVVPKKK